MIRILLFIGRNWLALWVCLCATAMVYLMHKHNERMIAAQSKPVRIDTIEGQRIDTLYAPKHLKK